MAKTTTTTTAKRKRSTAPKPVVAPDSVEEAIASLHDVITLSHRPEADASSMMQSALTAHGVIETSSKLDTLLAYCAEGAAIAVALTVQHGKTRDALHSAGQTLCDDVAQGLGARWSKGEAKIRLRAYLYATDRIETVAAKLASDDDDRPASGIRDLVKWCQAQDDRGVQSLGSNRNGQRVSGSKMTAADRAAARAAVTAKAKREREQAEAEERAQRNAQAEKVRDDWSKRVKRGGAAKHGGLVSMADIKRADAATLAATIAACEAAKRLLSDK